MPLDLMSPLSLRRSDVADLDADTRAMLDPLIAQAKANGGCVVGRGRPDLPLVRVETYGDVVRLSRVDDAR
jgi:hypothetical protein